MTLALLLACRLFTLVSPAGAEEAFEPSPTSDGSSDYAATLAEVERLTLEVNRDPEASSDQLLLALERLTRFAPQLADDPRGRELRLFGLLNLARAMLMAGDEQGAGLAMDEAIRLVRGDEIPAREFGPTLAEFHTQRRAALAKLGAGQIRVDCALPCRVILDEMDLEGGASGPLLFGTYRLWIENADPDPSLGPAIERHLIDIDVDGEIETIHYAPALATDTPSTAPTREVRRLLPRWAEIVGVVAGVGLVATGGALLSVDGRCPKGLDPVADAAECPKIYESTAGGFASLGIGAALALTGGVMLTIDEVNVGRAKGRQAVLSWTLRF